MFTMDFKFLLYMCASYKRACIGFLSLNAGLIIRANIEK